LYGLPGAFCLPMERLIHKRQIETAESGEQ
jgi:hypothetical protein